MYDLLGMDESLREIEARAQGLEWSIRSRGSTTAKLNATIKSAELYMQALRIADNPQDRKRFDAKCNALIKQAEHLKLGQDGARMRSASASPVSMRKLTTRENIIILEGSKLNGFVFKPWERVPLQDEFALNEDQKAFTDSPALTLSSTQLESFGGWRRPREALALLKIQNEGMILPNEPTMSNREKVDLVQDLTSDCSVVASLCAATSRVERGHAKISSSMVYPFDHAAQEIALSPNGKYIFRFYFNGCWRRIEVDDTLPTSKTSRLLHVIDRLHPGLLWPALTEKAYLKVRGGYDFPGSNSSTDLAVLSGWIPQQLFLHADEVEPNGLWEELIEAFTNGNIYLTMGTGKLSRREQKQLGLAAEHDYAVLDMKESGHIREVLIKNPWADGDVWKGAARRKPNSTHDSYPDLPPIDGSDEMLPGTFWMDFNSVFQHYENLYINWNPALFNCREDRHFSWTLDQRTPSATIFTTNPQFAIQSNATGEVWLLLSRHFRTGDYTQATSGKNGYISLYLFDNKDGYRALSTDGAIQRGPFVDSPNTLLRFEAEASKLYAAVVVQQDLPAGKHNFTLSLFSNTCSSLTEASTRYSTNTTLYAAWTRSTSGGNSDSVTYLLNPQFKLTLRTPQHIAVILRVTDPVDVPIHVKTLLSTSNGKRITRLRPRDTVANSGDYRRSACVFEKLLSAGTYTFLCSTFEANQYAKFTVDFYSAAEGYRGVQAHLNASVDATIEALPSEYSGRLIIDAGALTFTRDVNRMLAPLKVSTTTKTTIVARQAARNATSSVFRIALEQGQGPYKKIIADSSFDEEEFHLISTGLRIEDAILDKGMCESAKGSLWLVIERLAQGSGGSGEESEESVNDGGGSDIWIQAESQGSRALRLNEIVIMEILAEERVEVGAWGVGDG